MAFSGEENLKRYENALIEANDTKLPELFEKVDQASKELTQWLKAEQAPLKIEAKRLKSNLEAIDSRIFNISLYAGLVETVTQCAEGEPADISEKLHIMQRKLYMDEESLLDYQTGGMTYKTLGDFDEWLCKPKNLNRILPFPRCITAMQVRRNTKDRREPLWSLVDMFTRHKEEQADKWTFLYIRNGENVYCLSTDLKFDDLIFPDQNMFNITEPMMIDRRYDSMITRREYDELVKEDQEKQAAWEAWNRNHPEKEHSNNPYGWFSPSSKASGYEPFDQTNLYYDDAVEDINNKVEKYNRISLIIQGLFDRTDIFNPHPPIRSWEPESFDQNIKLIYDGSMILAHGEPPPFEEYIAQCNLSIDSESVLVGQQAVWNEGEYKKQDRYRYYDNHGNPGPGYIRKPDKWMPRARKAVFKWQRASTDWRREYLRGDTSPINCSITVEEKDLFNVSAYQPGDYLQFFRDPRTREKYLKWAPMLLAAEEHHRKVKKGQV